MDATYGSFGGVGVGYPGAVPPTPTSQMGQPQISKVPSDHSVFRSGSGNLRNRVNIWELILVPWLLLVLILVCYLQAGANGFNAVLFVIPMVLVGLNSCFLYYHYMRVANPEVVLGILSMSAILISLAVGAFGVWGALLEYHQLSQGASYFNVLSSEPAVGKADATTLVFTNATRVDLARSFGFTDTRTADGHVYCVAPVLSGDLFQTRIEYWAAGVDCCEARANFACFNSPSAESHGALVWPEASEHMPGFHRAVQGAQALHGLTASRHSMLLKWRKDPVGHRNALWNQTAMLFTVFGGVYLVISSMIGFALLPVIAGK